MAKQLTESDLENYPWLNGSEKQGTHRMRSLAKVQVITEDSPLVKAVTMGEAGAAISKIAFMFGHKLNRDVIGILSEALIENKWTAQEMENARLHIPASEELCDTITFNRTINPTVFAKARKTDPVRRGRLFEYGEAIDIASEKGKRITDVFGVVHVSFAERIEDGIRVDAHRKPLFKML